MAAATAALQSPGSLSRNASAAAARASGRTRVSRPPSRPSAPTVPARGSNWKDGGGSRVGGPFPSAGRGERGAAGRRGVGRRQLPGGLPGALHVEAGRDGNGRAVRPLRGQARGRAAGGDSGPCAAGCAVDSDIKVLEDQFDEIIVDIATKRKQYPRKILECVIKTIKAKQEILKQYCPVVHPLDLKYDPDPASRVETLKYRGETIAKEISEAMKSLPALIEQGDGFSQVLKMQPIIQLQRVHQEVFSGCYKKPDTKPESFITQIETTPTETSTRKATDVVLKRRQTEDCPQRKRSPTSDLRNKFSLLDPEPQST
uniref:NSL1 component of MIS12 kinetochore complex n=2 Tax=Canis lupus familiaris TaxID=9615 RepID=A0A8P0TEP9_CANLF